uniref:Ubiquitin-like domain-containing protein n=1 Tax=Oryza meridionalis TaxID=40149 RepID=A0A0E0D5X9_9ORYZ
MFFVPISGLSISMYKDRMVRIREAVDEALAQANVKMKDSYIEYHHKKLNDDDTIFSAGVMCNTHVYVKQRFRGGGNSARGLPFPAAIPLKSYIETQGYKKERLTRWFVEKKLPSSLIEPGFDDSGFFLNNSAKKCGAMLSEILEGKHKCSRCFDGFEESDIFYDPLKEEFIIAVPTIEFTPAAYKKDWKACKKILEKYFRYPTPTGKLHYPLMVDEMVGRIDKLEEIKNAGILWRDRVLLYRHPCFKTDAEMIDIFFQLVLHYHTLDPAERKIFVSCFGEDLKWGMKAELSRELKKVMNFTAYDKRGQLKLQKLYIENDGFSLINMCRCALQHVVRPGMVSQVDVFVLLCFIFKDLVPKMIESMLKYSPSEISEGIDKSQNHLKMIEILGFLEPGRDLQAAEERFKEVARS